MPTFAREPVSFWRKARRRSRFSLAPDAPDYLPAGRVVRVPGRGEMFIRYQPGPSGAPTVLLNHGWMASADINWLGAYGKFSDRYHLLAVDHRGHGRGIRTFEPFSIEDCADDIAGLMNVLGIPQVIAVGFSMGGPISLALARRHSHRVSGLVLSATSAHFGREGKNRFMDPAVRALNPLFRLGLPDWGIKAAAKRRPAILGEMAELAPWMGAEMKRLHPGDISAAGKAIAAFDARPWLAELGVPTASVITTKDRAVPPEWQRDLADALAARVVELDAGHTVCATAPHDLGWAVRAGADLVADQLDLATGITWRSRRRAALSAHAHQAEHRPPLLATLLP